MISSYQNYAKKTGLSMDEITLGHELEDAFLLKGLRPGLTLILYNKEKYGPRMKHTLWHEIGHVKCDHKKRSEKEEIEAHFFSAHSNAPNVLIKTIAKRGYKIDVRFLMECFGLSEEAAQKKMGYLNKYGFDHSNEYDDIVQMQFANYIDAKYPPKTKYFYDEYYDELDRERESWY